MYKVRIDKFEGPFDLLVYLLENAKMNIYDIRVSEITSQYIDYLKAMESMNVEVGSEFIVLAAVLIRLKSRMLLPRVSDSGEVMMDEDPRTVLQTKLLEYVKIKKIAEALLEREEYNLHIHAKPAEDMSRYLDDPDEFLKTDMDQFVNAFMLFLEKRKKVTEVRSRYQRARRERASVEDRIAQIAKMIDRKFAEKGEVKFRDLVPEGADKYDVTLSFVSLLEMIKMQEIDALQDEVYGDIRVIRREKGTGPAGETGGM